MLLAIDVGNTNIKFGVYKDEKLIHSWRFATRAKRTADEYGIFMLDIFKSKDMLVSDLKGVIISSVNPEMNYTIEHMCSYYLKVNPLMVGPGIKTGLNIRNENPNEVGADRIANCVAAMTHYGYPAIVVDFGTATTLTVISKNQEYLGGAICPGIKTSMNSLVSSTAKLPQVELVLPPAAIGRNTKTNMQSGLIYGTMGMVSYLIRCMKKEMGDEKVLLIGTGGLGELICKGYDGEDIVNIFDRELTLEGLRLIFNMNKAK